MKNLTLVLSLFFLALSCSEPIEIEPISPSALKEKMLLDDEVVFTINAKFTFDSLMVENVRKNILNKNDYYLMANHPELALKILKTKGYISPEKLVMAYNDMQKYKDNLVRVYSPLVEGLGAEVVNNISREVEKELGFDSGAIPKIVDANSIHINYRVN